MRQFLVNITSGHLCDQTVIIIECGFDAFDVTYKDFLTLCLKTV